MGTQQQHTALGMEILAAARNDLYLSLRFLDSALSGLDYQMSPLISGTATDGKYLYFQPRYLFRSFDTNPVQTGICGICAVISVWNPYWTLLISLVSACSPPL